MKLEKHQKKKEKIKFKKKSKQHNNKYCKKNKITKTEIKIK